MKHNKIFSSAIFIFALLIGITLSAQNTSIKWGKKSKIKRLILLGNYSNSPNDFYSLFYKHPFMSPSMKRLIVLHCDNKGNILNTKNIKVPRKDGKYFFNCVKSVNNQLYLFLFEKDSKAITNYYFKIEKDGGVDFNKGTEISKISMEVARNAGKDLNGSMKADMIRKFKSHGGIIPSTIFQSPDRSKFLTMGMKSSTGNDYTYLLKVFDDNMNVLWKKDIKETQFNEDLNFKDAVISNDGKVYIMTYYQEGRRSKIKGEPNYHYKLFSYDKNGLLNTYDISYGDRFITEIDIKVNKKNNLICYGIYSYKNYEAEGIFYKRIDGKTGKITAETKTAFTKELRARFMEERKVEKGKGIDHLRLREPILLDNGNLVLFAEQFYTYTSTSTSTNSVSGETRRTTTVHHVYNNILTANINPDGKIIWMKGVLKTQVGGSRTYLPYFPILYKGKIHLIFNDNKDNIKKDLTYKDSRGLKNLRKDALAMVVINEQGEIIERKEIADNSELDRMYVDPRKSVKLEDNAIVLFSGQGKHIRYGILHLK